MPKGFPADGGAIRDYREAQQLTQEGLLARALIREPPLKIDLKTIQNAEAGRNISSQKLRVLAEVLFGSGERWRQLTRSSSSPIQLHVLQLYEVGIAVRPVEVADHPVRHGEVSRVVQSDNIALISYRAEFSHRTQCRSPFQFRYRTRRNGFVSPARISGGPNLRTAAERLDYDDLGTTALFRFDPVPGEKYTMELDLIKGFDEGNRDVHFHLPKGCTFAVIRLKLDLRAYRTTKYLLTAPRLYIHEDDPQEHGDYCTKRGLGMVQLPCPLEEAGVWIWERFGLNEGVLDLALDWQTRDAKRRG